MNEFFSASDVQTVCRLAAAVFLGGLIGLEREKHGKEAGLRTYAIVSVGAALIMLVSTQIFELYKGQADVDPSRVAAQVVSGIGFLGAGAIIRFSSTSVKGLTTAAGLWVAAGIGLACGIGAYKPALVTTVFVLIILTFFSRIDAYFEKKKA